MNGQLGHRMCVSSLRILNLKLGGLNACCKLGVQELHIGLMAVALALRMCDRVSLYGFGNVSDAAEGALCEHFSSIDQILAAPGSCTPLPAYHKHI